MGDDTQAPPGEFVVDNIDTARFECVYPRCGGICCKQGRPALEPEEKQRVDAVLPRLLERLRPAARRLVEQGGYLTRRKRGGKPMLAVVEGWCVFFAEGCVLHKLGAEQGDKWRYKPWQCSTFPLTPLPDRWHVRQHGDAREEWDLFCLDPAASPVPAAESLAEEVAQARKLWDAWVAEATARGAKE